MSTDLKSENSIVVQKSYAFAQRIVKLYLHLMAEGRVRPLASQLLRSGTSIGANLEEAVGGQSRRDFAAKSGIAYREARETHYWLRLLRDTQCLEPRLAESLLEDAQELKRILAAIQLRLRREPPTQ
jgi:four helix bundle protein